MQVTQIVTVFVFYLLAIMWTGKLFAVNFFTENAISRIIYRNAVEDWCRLRNHTTEKSLYTIQKFGWGPGDDALLYDKGRSPIYCFDPSTGDSIAALHIFSSGDSQTVRTQISD